ncbi:MAG: Gfo/Idh/MocA family oxidoreductase, partial [Roseibacillus sp.]|nr:Gfo/Idh/MocA family oxidoreductase [Roseibacillus sp.]
METTDSFAQSSRRRFLQGAAATSALGFPAIVSAKSPNAKLDVAVIGCGGRGGHNMRTVGNTENIVALVDVNGRNLRSAASRFPKAATYHDFRKFYEKPGNYDAVVVSTTEHTHAFAT